MTMLYLLSAKQLRELFLKGEVSAQEIAQTFLDRIDRYNPQLGAFLEVFSSQTLVRAEHLDRKRRRKEPLGKMAAIPIGIKDNMHMQGEITTCASRFLQNYKAPFSATAICRMEEEDALFIGKTNLDEFAMGSATENSAYFPTFNPWDLSRVPGGSSGGSAAAVAARLCPIATGSDTGGSIRQPAGLCGVVGFKPTYGRVSRYGLVAFGSSLDQIGPLTSCVEDAALTMEVIGCHCPKDSTSLDLPAESYSLIPDLTGVHIGVPWHFLETLRPEIYAQFQQSIDRLVSLGAKIHEINLDLLKYSIAIYYILATAEASTNLARFDGIRYGKRSLQAQTVEDIYTLSRQEGFGSEVKRRILLGTYVLSSGHQEAYYTKAQKMRTLILDAFDSAFQHCDAIAMPISPSGAFPFRSLKDPLDLYMQDIFSIPANLAGLPAVSVPAGFDSEGMPLGLQLIGPQMCDVSVLQYAYAFEQSAKVPTLPPLFHHEVS